MNDLLVSIIIPTYSRPINLKRAIDSALAQSYPFIEIIVVDDNGEGTSCQVETEQVVAEYKNNANFHYLKHEMNKNGAAARNTGIQYAHGVYISFLDDDDELLPGKIAIQVEAMKRLGSEWGGCYCNLNLVGRKRRQLLNHGSGNMAEEMLLGTVRFNSTTLLIRREVCMELGGFDENFRRHQDWEFMLRFFRLYKIFLPTEKCLVNKYSSISTQSNLPDGEAYIRIKTLFLETFKTDIAVLPSASVIYHKHWMSVASVLLSEGKCKLFFHYFKLACSFRGLNREDLKDLLINFGYYLLKKK